MSLLRDETVESIPYGCGNGVTPVADEPAQDVGSDRPQEIPGLEVFDVASLRRTLQATAARIEAECGGTCRCECLVSSDGAMGSGFIVTLTVDGESATGHGDSLDDAELAARLEVSVKLAQRSRRKAVQA